MPQVNCIYYVERNDVEIELKCSADFQEEEKDVNVGQEVTITEINFLSSVPVVFTKEELEGIEQKLIDTYWENKNDTQLESERYE